jgi:signal transduction histidine kinase
LKKTTSDIEDYINNINYSLKISGVRLVNYHPDNHELIVFSDLNKAQYHLSQIRCVSLVAENERTKARGLLLRMDHRTPGNISVTIQTRFHDEQRRNIYLSFKMVPVMGKDGLISHYFGMCRNESETVYTEQMLIKETKKAQETEELKNTFLLNMSYEIRTPLNAVLGFAELFNSPHDEEDEPVFADEIKRNTRELLALVNDILFISRLDAKMVEYNYTECDFSKLFDGFCYMGWSNIAPGVKVSVENPYSRLIVKIDEQHLGSVISKICSTSARMTETGTIRAKYDYRHGELNITIEDTGRGLSKKALSHVFDRFVHDDVIRGKGSGLNMPIIQEMIRQMGGSIEIQSEEGKGSTVYVIIPCEMTAMEKSTEHATK